MKIQKSDKVYRHACLGGTFDHLHIGHTALISEAFLKADFVSIGVSTQSLKHKKELKNAIQDFDTRRAAVLHFLEKNNWHRRASLFPIDDIYGPTTTDESINMLIVTKQTLPNAHKINRIRKECGLPLCKIIVIPYVKDGHNKIISATRIRAGEIDTDGHNYIDIFRSKRKLVLPVSLRKSLRDPLGTIIAGRDNEIGKTGKRAASFITALTPPMIISVGDIATESLQDAGIMPHLSVIDFKTRRTHLIRTDALPKKGYTLNPAGTLCKPAIIKLHAFIRNLRGNLRKAQIFIKGEEDLLTLPAILFAPIGAIVVYGQYDVGLVVVNVNLEVKKKVVGIVRKFE